MAENLADKILAGAYPAALYSADGGELKYKNDAARSSALFNAANLAELLGEQAAELIALTQRIGFASANIFFTGEEPLRIMLLGVDGGIVAVGDRLWSVSLLPGVFVPASDISGDVMRDSINNIYYAARSLVQDDRDDKLIDILNQSYRLLRLEENSRIVAQFYSGALKPKLAPCQLDQTAKTLCSTISMVCLGVPPISFTSEGDCSTLADRSLLETALLNLISNSIRFTRDGNEISVSVTRRGSSLIVTVSDRGAGIKNELLPQVTQPYFSSDPYNDGAPRPGVGLGLSVAHAAAQLHGGSLVISSEFSQGTTVTLSIPVHEGGEAAELRQTTPVGFIRDVFSPVYIHLSGVCEMV